MMHLLRHAFVPKVTPKEFIMLTKAMQRTAKIRYGLAALLVGLPIPVVLIAFLVGGCR